MMIIIIVIKSLELLIRSVGVYNLFAESSNT